MQMVIPLPETVRPLRRVEYDRLVELGVFHDERLELLEGQLVQMSPIGSRHSSAVQLLNALLVPALSGRATVRIQSPFGVLETSEPEPDVAVVPTGDYVEEHPTTAYLLIEVAESSLRLDRVLKARLYAQATINEYWIVNVAERCIEVYRQPQGDHYRSTQRIEYDASIAPLEFPDVEVAVSDILK